MPRIAHIHHNTEYNVNIGDEAHVLAIQEILQTHIGDVEYINFPISVLPKIQIPPALPGNKNIPSSFQNMYRTIRGRGVKKLLDELNGSDMVLIGGGGIYMDGMLPFYNKVIDGIMVPIVIYGVGYNQNFGSPDFDAIELESIKQLGHKASLQSVRDVDTQKFLDQFDIPSTLIGDPAIFLSGLYDDSLRKTANTDLRIGMNIAAHGWKQQSIFEQKIIEIYADFAKILASKKSVEFYYFVHHPEELKVINALQARGLKFTSVVNTDARQTMGAYGQMDITISMMLHSAILSFGNSVPTVNIGYDKKNLAFMSLSDQKEQYIDIDSLTLDKLVDVSLDLIANHKAVVAKLVKGKNHLEVVSDKFADDVVSLLL